MPGWRRRPTPSRRRPKSTRRRASASTPPSGGNWKEFIRLTADQPPWRRVVESAARFAQPGDALDLGAGGGRDTRYLLLQGWRVTAVDGSTATARVMRRMPRQRWLRYLEGPIEKFEPETYDLVSAQFALPFVAPDRFRPTLRRLIEAVRPSGVLTATFFGPNDEWNVPGSAITFNTRNQLPELVHPLDIIELDEEDRDGNTADGTPKHWHVFHVIARAGD